MDKTRIPWIPIIAAALLLMPFLHPLLQTQIGFVSHLMWFIHPLAIAVVTYQYGRFAALGIVILSCALVVSGERSFGAGYGNPADWQTAFSLGVSTFSVNLLMVGFAIYARRITRRHRLLFNELVIGVIRTDAKHIIKAVNPEVSRILEKTEDDLLGQDINKILPSPVPDLHELEDLKSWTGKLSIGKEGEQKELHIFIMVLTLQHPHALQILILDRTLEVTQDYEIERQSKLASLGEALAGIAHEFNNPLQIISGYAELAKYGDQSTEKMRERFGQIKEQADRMRDMVQDLLGYSRQTLGGKELVQIPNLVREIISMERMVVGKRIKLIEQIEWQGSFHGSATKIQQIIINFISNSADAIVEGGGSTITVRVTESNGWLELMVDDDGPGIPETFMDKVFQPFATTKEKGKGTGLGLAISMRFARSMDGEIIASNKPEGGAVLTLRLPLTGLDEESVDTGQQDL